MAHKKGASSSRNGRDSSPQYLGVKKFGGSSSYDNQNSYDSYGDSYDSYGDSYDSTGY